MVVVHATMCWDNGRARHRTEFGGMNDSRLNPPNNIHILYPVPSLYPFLAGTEPYCCGNSR